MTAFDYGVLAILGTSMLLGFWRGVISELLVLVGWVLAFVAARAGATDGAHLLDRTIADPAVRLAAAMVAIFVLVLLVVAVVRFVVRKLVQAAGLGLLDRLLGMVFGLIRGALVALVVVMLGGLTLLPRQDWWRNAILAPPLETAVIAFKPRLPADLAKRINFR